MENTNNPEVKTKIIKLLTKGHERQWNPERTWLAFEHLIKNLQQIRTITDYSKHAELAQQACSLNIVELAGKVQNLLSKDKNEVQKRPATSSSSTANLKTNQQTYVNKSDGANDENRPTNSRNFYPTRGNSNYYAREIITPQVKTIHITPLEPLIEVTDSGITILNKDQIFKLAGLTRAIETKTTTPDTITLITSNLTIMEILDLKITSECSTLTLTLLTLGAGHIINLTTNATLDHTIPTNNITTIKKTQVAELARTPAPVPLR